MRYSSLIVCCFFLFACTPKQKPYEIKGRTMGTTYSVKYYSNKNIPELKKDIEERLEAINNQMSTYIPDSEISLLNKGKANKKVPLSYDFGYVLQHSLRWAEKTQGQFDPTIGPLVNLWGFGPSKRQRAPSKERISSVKEYVGYKKLRFSTYKGRLTDLEKEGRYKYSVKKTHDNVYVDLSASAKGFGVDALSELLTEKGLKDHLVEIGGELRAQGQKEGQPWRVAIEKPDETRRAVQMVLPLNDKALATSGSYRNFYRENGHHYSHTIDHTTGRPVTHKLVSASVLSKDCMDADAAATALMAMGPDKAWEFAQQNNMAALLIIDRGTSPEIKRTEKFNQWTRQ